MSGSEFYVDRTVGLPRAAKGPPNFLGSILPGSSHKQARPDVAAEGICHGEDVGPHLASGLSARTRALLERRLRPGQLQEADARALLLDVLRVGAEATPRVAPPFDVVALPLLPPDGLCPCGSGGPFERCHGAQS